MVSRCRVRTDVDSMSDHYLIEVTVRLARELKEPIYHTDPAKLANHIGELEIAEPKLTTRAEVDGFIGNLTISLQDCIAKASNRISVRKQPIPWWNPVLEKLKRCLKGLSRRIRSCGDPLAKGILEALRDVIREGYRKAIAKSRIAAFRTFCTQNKPWGKAFSAMKARANSRASLPLIRRADGTLCASLEDSVKELLKEKFPRTEEDHEEPQGSGAQQPAPVISSDEVTEILRVLSTNKAPGPDRICVRSLKALNLRHPSVLPALFTSCLALGYFPTAWRQGRVIFLPKPGKNLEKADGHRPITLLSMMGKLFERTINSRLVGHFDAFHPLNNLQYGFRRKRGTEQAIHQALRFYRRKCEEHRLVAAISLDIKGAFDHAEWPIIVRCLSRAAVPHYLVRCVQSYFQDRTVECEGQRTNLERGCPQGSVLGPSLWNIVYDGAIDRIHMDYPEVCVYADDTLVIIGCDTFEELEEEVTDCIELVSHKLGELGLKLNFEKTEILFRDLRTPRERNADRRYPKFTAGGVDIEPSRVIKYLGVLIDSKLTFDEHLRDVKERCLKRIPLLQSVARNTYGYGFHARRTMFTGYVYSLLMYCSSVFYHRLMLKKNQDLVRDIERRCNIIMVRGYRDLSGHVAALLAGQAPLNLKIVSRSTRWMITHDEDVSHWGHLPKVDGNISDGFTMDNQPVSLPEVMSKWRSATLHRWELEWQGADVGRWTHSLFPTVRDRLREKHLTPTFWLSQALSGHGVFRAYLESRKRCNSKHCPCGFGPETAEHVLWECLRFTDGRPLDWTSISEAHVKYMELTIRKLWKLENPNFNCLPE